MKRLPPHIKRLFWDVETKSTDVLKHRSFVITRVAEKGGMKDMQWLIQTYGKQDVAQVVKKSKNVSVKTKNFWKVISS